MSSGKIEKNSQQKKFPIIYSRYYNIRLFGIQKLHPFDSEKYGRVYRYLKKRFGLKKINFYQPEQVTDEELLKVHSQEYLSTLNDPEVIASVAELDLIKKVPISILKKKFLAPMRYATGGTLLGIDLAFKYGWAINLSGGYHHAKSESGSGFCFYADIPLACLKIFEKHPDYSILIIDLDAHQGNGIESVLKDRKGVFIFDVYNEKNYPRDYQAKKYIDFDFPVQPGIKDEDYLKLIQVEVGKAIKKVNPDFIIYNAGTDIYVEDALGKLAVTKDGIIKRDEIIFRFAFDNKIPILMVLSGGYHKKSAQIISESIENILQLEGVALF